MCSPDMLPIEEAIHYCPIPTRTVRWVLFYVPLTRLSGEVCPPWQSLSQSKNLSCPDTGIPEGWVVSHEGTDRIGLSEGFGSGCGIRKRDNGFTQAFFYLCSRDASKGDGHAFYGSLADHKQLELEPNEYHLTFGVAAWDCSSHGGDRYMKVTVETFGEFDEEGNAISGGDVLAEEFFKVGAAEVDYTTGNCVRKDIPFTVTEKGNVVLKFWPCNSNGDPAGWSDGVALGDVKVQFVPGDVLGLEMVQELEAAKATAKNIRDSKNTDRYAGEAFNALDEVVNKYENEIVSAPSDFKKAIKALQEAGAAMTAHAEKCDNFDKKPQQALDALKNLEATINKYATVTEETVEGAEGEEPTTVYTATPKFITDDAQLDAAVAELQAAMDKTGLLTIGNSSNGTKGYAALHERLRLGVETAKALGMTDEDEVVKYVNSIKGDDDNAADLLKKTITAKLYEKLQDANQTIANSEAGYSLDMSVFIKNPNIYVTKSSNSSQDPETCPGWTIQNDGEGDLSVEWSTGPANGGHMATDEAPCDEAISVRFFAVTFKQEITDLPAGVYQFTAAMGERRSDNDMPIADYGEDMEACQADIFADEYMFVKATAGDTIKTHVTTNGKSWGTFTTDNTIVSEPITITDGKVAFGAKNDGTKSWFAFNDIKLTLINPAAGFDYTTAYNQSLTGIDVTEAAPAKVKAIGLYDLNGRQLPAAKKGVVIVKKVMSDGTVKTEKVVK